MQIKNMIRRAGLFATVGFVLQLAGCGGGDTAAAHGTLRVALTNTGTSTCGYDEVNIAVDTVRVNPIANAGPSDGNWQPRDVAMAQSKKVDLLRLSSSAPLDLVTMTVSAGRYAQVRVWLEQSSVLVVMPNSVVLSGTKFALDTSNAASFSIPHEFTVPANGQVTLTLDFDACKSVVDAGNGKYQLAPSITATSTTGA